MTRLANGRGEDSYTGGSEGPAGRVAEIVVPLVVMVLLLVAVWVIRDDGDGDGEGGGGAEVERPEAGRGECAGWVALTFDDGPVGRGEGQTTELLKVLDELGVPATFFMLGQKMTQWPAEVQAVLESGRSIGNHSWDHANLRAPGMRRADVAWQLRKTAEAYVTIASRTAGAGADAGGGQAMKWWRPPYGAAEDREREVARRLGARETLWTVDPKDWVRGRTAEQIVERSQGMTDGGVLLLHEGVAATVTALPEIVESYWARGLCWGVLGKVGKGEGEGEGEAQAPQESPALKFWVRAVPPPRDGPWS